MGTDPQQCKELREILQARISDSIVTTSASADLPSIQESDTVIITSEEKSSGVLYRRLLNKLEEEINRAKFLGELIRLYSSSARIEDVLDSVVTKSTEILGDTAFIILCGEESQIRLDAVSSRDRERLIKMLMSTINILPQGFSRTLFADVLDRRQPLLIPNLQHSLFATDLRTFIDKYSVVSLLAVPIQTKERVLGAYISMSSAEPLSEKDLATAVELGDFTAMALENARLFAELQRSVITDALTGVYNTRFFHEVLAREAARADRYNTPLSLLMIDVDTFKLVNDTYGHLVGNKVLTQLAKAIEQTGRHTIESPTVP